MEDAHHGSLDLQGLRSRVKELEFLHRNPRDEPEVLCPSDSETLLQDLALQVQTKVKSIVEEYSDVNLLDVDLLDVEDSDAYLEYLRKELQSTEAESAKVSEEIERLSRSHAEDSNRVERDLEALLMSLDCMPSSQEVEKAKENPPASCSTEECDTLNWIDANAAEKFKMLELENQIEEKRTILQALEDLESVSKRFDAEEQLDNVLTGLKVLEFDGKFIRIQLQTLIPKLDGLFRQNKLEHTTEPSELIHEMVIHVKDNTTEITKVEMFPNDVYIEDIIEATDSFRERNPWDAVPIISPEETQITLHSAVQDTRSSFQWVVSKVQERIILTTLRKYMVKSSKNSRHAFEYYNRDETIVAHIAGGIDAFLKVSHGWPLLNTPLKLVSLKTTANQSKEIPLSLICKVEELANSLDLLTRQNLSGFVDAIEKILVQQTRQELHSNETSQK